jgi:hypothetical protein
MKKYRRIIVACIVLILGLYLGTFIFVSKTEQMISWIYLCALLVVITKRELAFLFYILAAIFIFIAAVLYSFEPSMVRYIHYIDKLSLWSYYFFGTALVLSITNFVQRKNT